MTRSVTGAVSGKPSPRTETIVVYGHHGHSVRVFTDAAHELVRVQWRSKGERKTKSWPNTRDGVRDAKAWARAFAENRNLPTASRRALTLREIWERYSTAEFPHLRPRTQENYAERWTEWERFVGRHFAAEDTTMEMIDDFRRSRAKAHLAVNQTGEAIKIVKLVYRWAERRELLARNRVGLYRFKVAKEDRSVPVAEYNPADYPKLLAQFDPRSSRSWRAWVLTVLCGTQGMRINAALHLRWPDVDFEANTVAWSAAYDKMGQGRVQPLTAAAREALYVALGWSGRNVRATDWVMYTPRGRADGTYDVSSYWRMLRSAEDAAGVAHIARRAAHGLRRMAAGNALALTQNPIDAMHWIGDRDLTQAKRYLKERDERMREIASGTGRVVTGQSGAPPAESTEGAARETATKRQPAAQGELRAQDAAATTSTDATTYEQS